MSNNVFNRLVSDLGSSCLMDYFNIVLLLWCTVTRNLIYIIIPPQSVGQSAILLYLHSFSLYNRRNLLKLYRNLLYQVMYSA